MAALIWAERMFPLQDENMATISKENNLLKADLEAKAKREMRLNSALILARARAELSKSDLNNSWCFHRRHSFVSDSVLNPEMD